MKKSFISNFLLLTLFLTSTKVFALPPTWPEGSFGVNDGTGTAGVDLLFQFASTVTGIILASRRAAKDVLFP